MKILNMVNRKESIKYTWDERWVQPYESPFSIFQKLMYANVWSFKELYRELGSSEFKSRKTPLISYKFGSLYTLEGFDLKEISCRLGVDMQSNYLNVLSELMDCLGVKLCRYEEELQYCAVCLKQGYHSIFHQFHYINQCFIHGTPLHKSCPKCHLEFMYNLRNLQLQKPFQCLCSYNFLAENSERKFFKNWSVPISVDNNQFIHNVFSLSKSVTEQIKRMYITEVPQKERANIDIVSVALNCPQKPDHLTSQKLIYTRTRDRVCYLKTEMKLKTKTTKYNYLSDYDGEEMFWTMQKIYKAISRKIRKCLLKKHKKCWKYYQHRTAFYNKPLCPYVYAYVHWQGEIQGRKECCSIYNSYSRFYFEEFETYSKSDWNYMYIIYGFIRNNVIVKDPLYHDNTKSMSQVTPNFFVTKWILAKIYALILLAKFHCWFEIALEYAPRDKLFFRAPSKFHIYKKRYYPFYLFYLPDRDRDFAEFIFKVQHEPTMEINPIRHCPTTNNEIRNI